MSSDLRPILIAAAALTFLAVLWRPRRRRARTGQDGPSRWRLLTPAREYPILGMVGLVAGREIRQRLRGRTFRVATALILLGVTAAIVIPIATRGKPHTEQVGIVGNSTSALRTAITAAATAVNTHSGVQTEADLASAEQALRSGKIDVAVIDASRLVVHKPIAAGDSGTRAQFVRALAQNMGMAEAERDAGLTAEQAARLARSNPLPVRALQTDHVNTAARGTATIAVIVLFLMLTQYLSWTLMGVMEEKSSRVVEVLLSTVRPLHMLTGKVLGIAAVVFAQAAVVAGYAFALATAVGSDLLQGSAPLVLLSALLWLLLGYGFYCWLYAAAGATVERQEQVQALAIPLALPMTAGYILSLTVAASGAAPTYFKALAYIPPTAPFAMTTLVGLGAVTWWQFILSAALTAASAVALARLAATIYRRAILRTGRRTPLRQLIRTPHTPPHRRAHQTGLAAADQ
ncbi:MAG: ABC transporter permease [Jatrophihabitantaceae bacterium]